MTSHVLLSTFSVNIERDHNAIYPNISVPNSKKHPIFAQNLII